MSFTPMLVCFLNYDNNNNNKPPDKPHINPCTPPNFLCIAWCTLGSQITSTLHVWLDKSIIFERNNLVITNTEVHS